MSETDDPRSDLDVSEEPEPDWADAIRRGRRERGERLRDLLADVAGPEPEASRNDGDGASG